MAAQSLYPHVPRALFFKLLIRSKTNVKVLHGVIYWGVKIIIDELGQGTFYLILSISAERRFRDFAEGTSRKMLNRFEKMFGRIPATVLARTHPERMFPAGNFRDSFARNYIRQA